MEKELRVGVIGAGWPGQQHARGIQSTRNATLYALAEPNEERAREFKRTFAPERVLSDYA